MNQCVKRLISFILICLTLSTSHSILGMDDVCAWHCEQYERERSLVKHSSSYLDEFYVFNSLREGDVCKEVGHISELNLHILKYTAALLLLNQPIDEWSAVCGQWSFMMKKHKIEIYELAICQVYLIDPETVNRFLNARLVYEPNPVRLTIPATGPCPISTINEPNKENQPVELRIADVENPLHGNFNLPPEAYFKDTYVIISTGYWTENWPNDYNRLMRYYNKPGSYYARWPKEIAYQEKSNRGAIWIVPRFLVEQEINGNASHFQPIFPTHWPETAPFGLLWVSLGVEDMMKDYYFLTDQECSYLNENNLFKLGSSVMYVTNGKVCSGKLQAGLSLSNFRIYF